MRPLAGPLGRWWTVRTRWVAALLCFAAVITIVVSSLLYSWYSRDSVEAFGEIAMQELVQTSTTMEMLDESIKNTGFDLVQDVDVLTLMAARAPMEQYAAVVRNTLMHPMLSNPLIASIYLVNRNGNFILGSPAPASVNVPQYHRRIVALIQGRKENAIIRVDANPVAPNPSTTAAAATVGTSTGPVPPFVSYVFFAGRMSEPEDSFLIINLRCSDILARIIAAGPVRGRALVVSDRAGQPLFIHDPEGLYGAEDISAALGRVLRDPRESGRMPAVRIGGTTSLVAFAAREPLGLRFVSVTPYRIVLRSSRLLRTRTMALGILILLVGAAGSVLIARRFYLPLAGLLAKYGGARPRTAGGQDEYQQLDRLLESSSARATSLERNLPLIRQEYLQRVLDGQIALDSPVTRERLRELGIEFPHEVFRVVWFAAGRGPASIEALRRAVQAFARLVEGRGMRCEIVDGRDGASAVAVVNHTEDSPSAGEIIRDACMAAQAQRSVPAPAPAQGQTQGAAPAPTVAIGRSCRKGFAASWANARDLMAYQVKYGVGAVLDDRQVAADVVGQDLFPQQEEDELVEAVRTLSPERMRASVARMVRLFRGYSANDISRAVLHVLYCTLESMADMVKGHPVAVDDDFLSVHGRLSRCSSLLDMERELVAFYEAMIGRLAAAIRQAGTSHAHLMKKVIDFIAANYAGSQMSLDLVADHVGMNATYLGKVFKEYLGVHFTDYVTRVRLEESQRLLVETTMSIAEIAQKTGFNSPSYFITCFRKHAGVTPASYRNAKAL